MPNSEVHSLETATQTLGPLQSQAAPACGQAPLTQELARDPFLDFLSFRGCGMWLTLRTSWADPPCSLCSVDRVRFRVRV